MTSFAMLRNDDGEAEADPDHAAAAALAAIEAAAQRLERAIGGESPFARLLAGAMVRLAEATMAIEELRDRKADADRIAGAAYARGVAAGAASRRLRVAR